MVNRAEVIKSPRHVLDDTLFTLGNDNDVALVLKSGTLNANTALTGVAIGTPVAQALPVNSAILSNTTADGDILMLVNDGGNSKEFLLANGDTADLQLGHGMATATVKTASGDLTLNPGGDIDCSSNDLLDIGASGNDWTATLLTHAGSVVVGNTAKVAGLTDANFQIQGFGSDTHLKGSLLISRHTGAAATGPFIQFVKSRGTAADSVTIVADNDTVGQLLALPADGVDLATHAAEYGMEVDDASPAAGDIGMAHRWKSMPGGGASLREVMRISAAGVLSVLTAGSASAAQVDLFDAYDDATELQRFAYSGEGIEHVVPEVTEGQRLANRERMVEMGILERASDEGSDNYHMRMQPLTKLLAGGIYQNRHRMDSQYEQLNRRLEAIGA
jgi:hypothetical protein